MSADILSFLTALHLKTAFFTLLALTIVYMQRRSSSQNRYSVLKMALGVVALLPLLVAMLPTFVLPLDGWMSPPTLSVTVPVLNGANGGDSVIVNGRMVSTDALLLFAYGIISAGLLLRTTLGFLRTRKDIRGYRRIDHPELIALRDQMRRRVGVEKEVELVMDSSGAGPYVWGVNKQVIALPEAFLTASPDVQRTVLMHELIHIVRRDTMICLASRVLCCLNWINPAVWLLNARLKLEMEQSCDDRAVCYGINADEYAGHLLDAIRQFDVTHRPNSAVAMARASSIKHRIASLLNSHKKRGIMSTSKRIGILGALVFLGTAVGAAATRSDTDAALIGGVKALVPENCDTNEIRVSGDAIEINGRCASATRVAAFMRSLERSGGSPRMRSMHKTDNGQVFDMRLENLQSFAPVLKPGTEATRVADTSPLVAGVRRLVPDNCTVKELRVAASEIEIGGHCASATRVSAFMRSLERAGGKPSLESVLKADDGVDFKMRLTNLENFAPPLGP